MATTSVDLINVKAPLTHCWLLLTAGVSEEKGPLSAPSMAIVTLSCGQEVTVEEGCVILENLNRSSFIAAPALQTRKKCS